VGRLEKENIVKLDTLQPNLAQGVAKVKPFVPRRHTLPSILGLKLEAKGSWFTITGTDLEAWAEAEVGFRGETDGVVVVEATIFARLVASLPNALLHLEGGSRGLKISWEGGSALVPHWSHPDAFPPTPEIRGLVISLDPQELRQAISQVGCCAATVDDRPTLTCINWRPSNGRIVLAAADGFRLAIKEISGELEREINLWAKAMDKLAKALGPKETELEMLLGDTMAWFRTKRIAVGIVADKRMAFPNYPNLVPTQGSEVRVVRADLLAGLRRIEGVALRGSGVVRLESLGGSLKVSASADDARAQETMVAVGDVAKVAANFHYLMDALSVMRGETITLMIQQTPSLPCVVSDDSGLRHIIMPMFVAW
jgi:DNA polymerase III subunit beta